MKKTLTCEFEDCNKVFKYQSHYQRHVQIHTEKREFTCPSCLKTFKRIDHLENHERTHEQGVEELFSCTFSDCKQKFSSQAAVRYHLLTHKQQNVYICENTSCQKQFLTLGQLKQHYKTKSHQEQHQQQADVAEQIKGHKNQIIENLWKSLNNLKINGNEQASEKMIQTQIDKQFKGKQKKLSEESPISKLQLQLILTFGLVEKMRKNKNSDKIIKGTMIKTATALVNAYQQNIFDQNMVIDEKKELLYSNEEILKSRSVQQQQQETDLFEKQSFQILEEFQTPIEQSTNETAQFNLFDTFYQEQNVFQENQFVFSQEDMIFF